MNNENKKQKSFAEEIDLLALILERNDLQYQLAFARDKMLAWRSCACCFHDAVVNISPKLEREAMRKFDNLDDAENLEKTNSKN